MAEEEREIMADEERVIRRQWRRLERNDPFLTFLEIDDTSRQPVDEWKRRGLLVGRSEHLLELGMFGPLMTIGNTITSEHLEAFFEGFKLNRSLRIFCISGFDLSSSDGGFFRSLALFFEKNTKLVTLKIDDCYISPLELNSLSNALASPTNSLNEIYLRDNHFDDVMYSGLVSSFVHIPTLMKVNLDGTYMGRHGCRALANLIKSPPSFADLMESPISSLKVISLRGCSINDNDITAISRALYANAKLTNLNLSENPSITAIGYHALFHEIESPASELMTLSLCDNDIREDTIALLTSFSNNCKLYKLDLTDNPNISVAGMRILGSFLKSDSLKVLVFCGNNINDDRIIALSDGLERLTRLELSGSPSVTKRGWEALLSVLCKSNSRLERLDLPDWAIDDDFVRNDLSMALAYNSTLKALHLDYRDDINSVSKKGWKEFSTILCDKTSINATYLSNHTLECIATDPDTLPNQLLKYFKMNWGNDKKDVAADKILLYHFSGCFDMDPFAGMKLELLPHVLSWLGRKRPKTQRMRGRSALFQFLRQMPVLVETRGSGGIEVIAIRVKRKRCLRRLADWPRTN